MDPPDRSMQRSEGQPAGASAAPQTPRSSVQIQHAPPKTPAPMGSMMPSPLPHMQTPLIPPNAQGSIPPVTPVAAANTATSGPQQTPHQIDAHPPRPIERSQDALAAASFLLGFAAQAAPAVSNASSVEPEALAQTADNAASVPQAATISESKGQSPTRMGAKAAVQYQETCPRSQLNIAQTNTSDQQDPQSTTAVPPAPPGQQPAIVRTLSPTPAPRAPMPAAVRVATMPPTATSGTVGAASQRRAAAGLGREGGERDETAGAQRRAEAAPLFAMPPAAAASGPSAIRTSAPPSQVPRVADSQARVLAAATGSSGKAGNGARPLPGGPQGSAREDRCSESKVGGVPPGPLAAAGTGGAGRAQPPTPAEGAVAAAAAAAAAAAGGGAPPAMPKGRGPGPAAAVGPGQSQAVRGAEEKRARVALKTEPEEEKKTATTNRPKREAYWQTISPLPQPKRLCGAAKTPSLAAALAREDGLVVLRVDCAAAGCRLVEEVLWDRGAAEPTPEAFAAELRRDLELPLCFEALVAGQIREQLAASAASADSWGPAGGGAAWGAALGLGRGALVPIEVDFRFKSLHVRDRLELELWEEGGAPEAIARATAADLGLPGEAEPALAAHLRAALAHARAAARAAARGDEEEIPPSLFAELVRVDNGMAGIKKETKHHVKKEAKGDASSTKYKNESKLNKNQGGQHKERKAKTVQLRRMPPVCPETAVRSEEEAAAWGPRPALVPAGAQLALAEAAWQAHCPPPAPHQRGRYPLPPPPPGPARAPAPAPGAAAPPPRPAATA